MKAQIVTALFVLCSPLFANAANTSIQGTVRATSGCAESKLEILKDNKTAVCLGFDGLDQTTIILGRTYILEGYGSRDGFFAKKIVSDLTTWEVAKEIPVGRACPAVAKTNDQIAYQVNRNGGYVCFACDTGKAGHQVVTEQVKCSKTIECKVGTCL